MCETHAFTDAAAREEAGLIWLVVFERKPALMHAQARHA